MKERICLESCIYNSTHSLCSYSKRI